MRVLISSLWPSTIMKSRPWRNRRSSSPPGTCAVPRSSRAIIGTSLAGNRVGVTRRTTQAPETSSRERCSSLTSRLQKPLKPAQVARRPCPRAVQAYRDFARHERGMLRSTRTPNVTRLGARRLLTCALSQFDRQRGAFHLATSGRQPHFSSVLRSEDAVRVPRRTPDALRSTLEATGPWNELAVEQLDVAAAMASDMFVVGRDQEAGPGVTVDPVEQR